MLEDYPAPEDYFGSNEDYPTKQMDRIEENNLAIYSPKTIIAKGAIFTPLEIMTMAHKWRTLAEKHGWHHGI